MGVSIVPFHVLFLHGYICDIHKESVILLHKAREGTRLFCHSDITLIGQISFVLL